MHECGWTKACVSASECVDFCPRLLKAVCFCWYRHPGQLAVSFSARRAVLFNVYHVELVAKVPVSYCTTFAALSPTALIVWPQEL